MAYRSYAREQPEFDSQVRFVLRGWRVKRAREGHLCTRKAAERGEEGRSPR
jgi:hypothetical protein